MEFKNLEAIIDFAIEKEQEAAEFYETVSKEEGLSGSRQMLEEFAAQERKHEAMLKSFREGGLEKSMASYEFKWIKDIKRSNYIVDMTYEKGMAYNELLLLAMKREEKALALYNELLEKADTEDAKKIFKILCQEEAKHKLSLETIYDDFMADMGD